MICRSISTFIVFSMLIIFLNESINGEEFIDYDTQNISRELDYIHPIMTCKNRQKLSQSIFQCKSQKSFEIIEQSCITEPFKCFDRNYIGPFCNISYNACEMAEQCSNNGICYSNNYLSKQFWCECFPGYAGYDCSEDIRICKNNTCWHDGECIIMDASLSYKDEASYDCQCVRGYEGARCEHLTNMCENITCQNNGICVFTHLSWKCQCLGSQFYSGLYCEQKSTGLKAKQVLSKSVAYIAILAINAVVFFVIIMDVLKYGFKIDPVDRYRRSIRLNQTKRRRKKEKKIVLKSYYIS